MILKKAVKVPSEIEGLRQTYIDDGVAVTLFLHWLETEVASCREVSEWAEAYFNRSCDYQIVQTAD